MTIEEDLSEWDVAGWKKMLTYGFGYIVINYLVTPGFARVIYFYEVEMLMPLMYLSIAYVIFAVWNMVNDPLLGFITDKPRKWTRKWGLRAPWVVIVSGPMLLLYFLIWTPPQGNNLLMFFYFIITTCLFDAFFSIYNDHIYGGFTNQFPSEYERRKAFAIASILMAAIMTFMGVISVGLIQYGKPETYTTTALIMVILLIIFNFIQFAGLRESKEMKEMFIKKYEESEKMNFFTVAKKAVSQKNFLISLIGYTVSVTCANLVSSSSMYMFKDVYGLPYSMSMFTQIAGAVAFIIVIPFWYNFTRKHGFKKTYWICFILHGFTFFPFLFIGGPGWDPTLTITLAVIFNFIGGLCYSGEVLMLMPVAADTYDEVALVMGRRQDAMFVGIRTFFFRIAFVVVGIVIPVVHILTGYVPTDEMLAQSALATFGVRIPGVLIPMILFITMGFIFRKFYDLEGEKKAELVNKLKQAGLYLQ